MRLHDPTTHQKRRRILPEAHLTRLAGPRVGQDFANIVPAMITLKDDKGSRQLIMDSVMPEMGELPFVGCDAVE